jgi:hypothetical protein
MCYIHIVTYVPYVAHHQELYTVCVQQLVRVITPDDGQHMPEICTG